ncbi:hypothetical protein BBJ28_00017962 [Nothophytophthora sp. Chile5]|nr:hypothetical protein BBJ28_00017962 [Nothophytophthora sp. Chile5]
MSPPQLVDERGAVLAASQEQEAEGDGNSSVAEQEEREEAPQQAETPSDGKQVGAEAVASVREDDGAVAVEEEAAASSSVVATASPPREVKEDESRRAVEQEEPTDDKAEQEMATAAVISRKRRLLDTEETDIVPEGQDDGAGVKVLKKSKTKDQHRSADDGSSDSTATLKATDQFIPLTASVGELLEPAETPLPPLPYSVARTSVPPAKYLMQHSREEVSNRETLSHRQRSVLLASSPLTTGTKHVSSNGTAGAKRPAPTSRTPLASVEQTNSAFERKLRESVRLHREVNKRSLSMTRKRQLPRLPTPMRGKSHWDFLLEEMKWMATDFAQERNWKRVMQRHLAADVIVAQNAESVLQEQENRQMAREIALQVSAFWRTMERIAARSRVRFEAVGTESSTQEEGDDIVSTEQQATKTAIEDENKQKKSVDDEANGSGDKMVTLKYKTIDVAASNGTDGSGAGETEPMDATLVTAAKVHMTYIVSAGKRARSAMSSSPSTPTESGDGDKSATSLLREEVFRDLQAQCTGLHPNGGPSAILAAFQVLALRWMLELYSSGLNMFVNDQLGMGKAATIVAFLRLIELVASKQQKEVMTAEELVDSSVTEVLGPHLIVVAEEELHKWRYYLRLWHPDRHIQLYDTAGNPPSHREQLQREWKTKPRPHAHKDEDHFLTDMMDDEDEEWEEDERLQPVYCVLCPVNAFAEDQEAFVAFANWQMVIVENEHNDRFEDATCVSAMQQLRQRQRRVLCNGQPIENWKSAARRLQYAEFLVREAPNLEEDREEDADSSRHRVESWPAQQLLVERASAVDVMQLYGKSTSARASLWKASSQQENSPQCTNALLLALSCLSLRRVRSEVEPQLGKIEELSLSCQLSVSQTAQYRNALSGFAATVATSGGREERLSVWLQLLLRLREICNCVDLVNDLDKLGHADLRLLTASAAKLEPLEPLLRRLVVQEGKKVVLYCQFSAMFPILELFLSLLEMSFVRVTGSISMQRRALCHFADRRAVRVALVSTRSAMSSGQHAVSVFGGEAIIVVDSDWNATCDAKLRASWAKMAVGGADPLPVYRLHCENTVEASLLRVGASLTEKVFGEMTPQELLAVPSDLVSTPEKPSWWSSSASSSGGSAATTVMATLATVAQQVEQEEKYCGDTSELEAPLLVHNVDLDAEEHLLLANTDELTPVEWYAVDYVHGVTDKKQHPRQEHESVEGVVHGVEEESAVDWNDNAWYQSNQPSFEELSTLEADRLWQEGDASSQLFYQLEAGRSDGVDIGGDVDETALEKLFTQMRLQGMETHFDVFKPPQPPPPTATASSRLGMRMSSEAGATAENQMTFRVSYRVPAPPPPPLLPGKTKAEHVLGLQHGDANSKSVKGKKQRANAAAKAGVSATLPSVGPATGSVGGSATALGVKRKLESQLGGIKSGASKEQRVDLEGIPVPDASEFADDDFWGDTNLDALDSAEWDDPALLGDILGVGTASSSTASSTGTASSGAAAAAMAVGGTAGGATTTAGTHAESAHAKTGTQRASGSKKSKSSGASGSGRTRKSSMSSADAAREAWSVHDDIVLKKLFELYGSNWTLIAQVFNSATAVSRFFCKKRSPRQCYDRYGKIISGSLTTSTTASGSSTGGTAAAGGSGGSKDTKSGSSLKAHRAAVAAAAAASQLTPAVLDARIGLPQNEMLLTFPARHSLPGLPPPSIVNAPSLVEMTLKHRKKQTASEAAGKKGSSASAGGGLDDLKSIRSSFDAIIQCMKRKTSPPPIPIPVGAAAAAPAVVSSSAAVATDLSTKASLTAASLSPSLGAAATTTAKANSKAAKKAAAASALATTSRAMPVVVPPPHKSHADMVSLLPAMALGPDEVIKRSKEAAVVAVQAAAAVASVGRDGSPLSASGDAMLGTSAGFGASMPRRAHAASLTGGIASVGSSSVTPTHLPTSSIGLALPPTVPGSKLTTAGAAAAAAAAASGPAGPTTTPPNTGWGDMQGLRRSMGHGVNANGLSPLAAMELSGSGNEGIGDAIGSPVPGRGEGGDLQHRNPAMPVTTSTLLHVLDRMPEIKNKIQSILNRTDCSESQKVAMIARLLSNTNAINSSNAIGTTPSPPPLQLSSPSDGLTRGMMAHPAASAASSSAVLSALTADAALLSSSAMLIDTETPIPMPASLAAASPPNLGPNAAPSATSAASALPGQFLPPTSQP